MKNKQQLDQGLPSAPVLQPANPTFSPTGVDAEIYSAVKGDAGFDGKRTYYKPFSRVLLAAVCLVLIPVFVIYMGSTYMKNRYFATCGDFNVTFYNVSSPSKTYTIKSRDTKRFPIEEVEIITLEEKNGREVETVAVYQGYRIQDLMSVTSFKKDGMDNFDYFTFFGYDKEGQEITAEGSPRIDHYMILVYKIIGDTRYDVYGKAIPKDTQPKSFIITEPKSQYESDRCYNAIKIEFDLKTHAA